MSYTADRIEREYEQEVAELRALLRTARRWLNDGHELREPGLSELRKVREDISAALEGK